MANSSDLSPAQRGFTTLAVILAMLMQVLDQTIANVALPHMQPSLGANRETITWVLTAYIVASAIAIPITGWLAERVGRKPLFVWAVVVFTAASMLCAVAQNLESMVVFRVVQGVAGAFLVPLAQAVMFDIKLPIGAIAIFLMLRFLPTTAITKRKFDLLGFFLIAMALGGLQMMLDRGEHLDWFESWEIWIECGLFIAGTWMFIVHMLTAREPIFDPKMFGDRNFATGLLFMGVTGLMMLAGLALLPPLLQNLFGYSVLQSGMLTAPRGMGTLVSMIVVGRLMGKVDARILIIFGMTLMAWSLWMMSGFSLEMDQRPVILSGIVQGFALGTIFVPLNTLAFATLSPKYRTTAASLMNLARSIGGSIGISMVTVLLARNVQIVHSGLAEHVTPNSIPPIDPAITQGASQLTEGVLMAVDAEVNRQALMIAYINDFHLMMIISLLAIPLVLLLRKGRAPQPGEHAAAMD